MKLPAFFIGTTLLLWGYEKNILVIGVVTALLVEFAQFNRKRWQFDVDDFVKISDLTSVILMAATVLILLNYETQHFLIQIAGWLPLILLPLALAQVYGVSGTIVISTRLGSQKSKVYMHKPMDFRFMYIAATLFSAATFNSRHQEFFPIVLILGGWLLFVNRGRSFSRMHFLLLFLMVAILGAATIRGLDSGHAYVNRLVTAIWEDHFHKSGADPFKNNTSLGDVGRLKLSSKIIMRLEATGPPPSLLKEASYDVFSNGLWFNRDQAFKVLPQAQNGQYQLLDQQNATGSRIIYIEKYFPKNKGLLPYPYGSEQLMGLDLLSLSRNTGGLLRIDEGSVLQQYHISYHPSRLSESLPSEYSLKIPENEKEALVQVVNDMDLAGLSEQEKVRKIQLFLSKDFSYILETKGKGGDKTPLAHFLLSRKAGHCEFFATATALLLREAGIPSRYITGYAVSERSGLEQKYIVRSRHAHAWTEGFVAGQWLVIDTTPPVWFVEEGRQASFMEPFRDFLAFLKHQYNLFRARDRQDLNLPLSIAVLLMTSFLVVRIYLRVRAKNKKKNVTTSDKVFLSQDSPFILIKEELLLHDPQPCANESFLTCLQRVDHARKIDLKPLLSLYSLHQQLRFDPQGLSEEEKVELEQGVEHWLKQHKRDVTVG